VSAGRAWLAVVALLVAVATKAAFSCSFVDVSAGIAEAAWTSLIYYVAAAVCGAILIALELYWKQTPVLSILSLGLLVFHPYWWYSPLYMTGCSFPIVTDSQVVFGALTVMLAIRLLRVSSASRANPR
jgi:hypothetical protein